MAIKHNQQIPNNHFRKDWQRRVRCHFDQPGRKLRRRNARRSKAAAVAPRPVDRLRPIVRCPTLKYNRRVRAGRGFTLTELKEAGIARKLAHTIGISVDTRRQNLSEESLALNVERLKAYRGRLILFPRKAGKTKKGDASAEDVKAIKSGDRVSATALALPIKNVTAAEAYSEIEASKISKSEESTYRLLRNARSDARYVGVREKRAAKKAEDAQSAKK